MDHGFAKIFGIGLSTFLALRNGACGSVVFDNAAVIYGDISDALFEIADWVAAGFHDIAYQPISFDNGPFGIVDETSLIGVPRLCKAIALLRLERMNSKLLDPLLAAQEFLFSVALATLLLE